MHLKPSSRETTKVRPLPLPANSGTRDGATGISVLVLTRNEEQTLPGCLASLSWCDDIHVFDSYSEDNTVAIAHSAGAHVYQRAFDTYSNQRNAALDSIPFRHPWVFLLDADERPSPELVLEMQTRACSAPPEVAAFRVERRDYFWDKWLKHAQMTMFYSRLVKVGKVRYSRPVNEMMEVDGQVADLTKPLLHYPFLKGISNWVHRHDLYSTMEARLLFHREGLETPSWKAAFLDRDFHVRRMHQKALYYRMPARPVIKMLFLLIYKKAVLDGKAGITYSVLMAFYEYMIILKTRELERSVSPQSISPPAFMEQAMPDETQRPELAG